MRKCRTTSHVTYWVGSFDGKSKVYIDVYPQQKWEYTENIKGDSERVALRRNNVTLEIPKVDFEVFWEILEDE